MPFDATFWVGLAFVIFIGVLIYYKVPAMLTRSLDERSEKIRNELDEARKLREEAQALLANYERKQRDAMSEAQELVAYAREEAERERGLALVKLEESIHRREQQAVEKIAMAEAQAEKEVRNTAVEVAIEAATRVITAHVRGTTDDRLVDEATRDLRRHLQ